MERIKSLHNCQKIMLLAIMVIFFVFTIIYFITTSRIGFLYRGSVLIPSIENNSTVYSGKIEGKQTRFVVSEDKTVMFYYDETSYGPYSVKQDQTAIPKNQEQELLEYMTGIEIYEGEEVLFRGGVCDIGEYRWLYDEYGTVQDGNIFVTANSETIVDENGHTINVIKPSLFTILNLINGPELKHKGDWFIWFCGTIVCMVTAISIVFADELFRWQLSFQIRDVEKAEPSEWEMISRYIGWVASIIAVLMIFIRGLE